MNYPWAQAIIDICKPINPEIDQASFEGAYANERTHKRMVEAMIKAGYVLCKEDDGREYFIKNEGDQFGIAFARDELEPECMVWFFYDERMAD